MIKKAILLTLTALLLVSSMAACGSHKKADDGEPTYSRVLYAEDDTEEDDSEDESDETSKEDTSNKEESKEEKKQEKKQEKKETEKNDSDKTSSAKTSSKSASNVTAKTTSGSNSKTVSSNTAAVSSKTTVTSKNSTSSKTNAVSSKSNANSSKKTSSVISSSKIDSDSSKDSDKDSEIWYGSDSDFNDTDTASENDISSSTDTDSDDTDVKPIEKGTFEMSDVVFSIGDSQIFIGQNFVEADNILSGYNSTIDNGETKVYYYNQCTVTASVNKETGEADVITKITVSPGYTVSKGIATDSTVQDVLSAYGDPVSIEDSEYHYIMGGTVLIINFSDNIVTGIVYSANV